MLGLYRVGAGESCHRSGNPGDAGAAPTRERQPLDRTREELLGLLRPSGRVDGKELTGGIHPLGHHGGRLRRAGGELAGPWTRDRDDEVEAVEERPRELVAEGREPLWEHEHSTAGSPRAPQGQRFMLLLEQVFLDALATGLLEPFSFV